MRVDFLDAYKRHWEDAEHLFQDQRWANADHLYGLSAECGLKALMKAFGMKVDANSNPIRKQDRVHINKLWARYATYIKGPVGRGYSLPPCDPFSDWCVDQRYMHQSSFAEDFVKRHKDGANAVKKAIARAKREGRLL